MEIKILGTGCAKCKALEKSVRDAVAELNIQARITKIEDIIEIMNHGVIHTPGLVIDDKVVSSGRMLSRGQVKELILKNQP
jgi:small redox-active disulfide protein 2